MHFRRIGRIAPVAISLAGCCALGWAWSSAWADAPDAQPAQPAQATAIPSTMPRAAPSGILRLLSATQPIANPALQEGEGPALPLPEGAAEPAAAGPLQWSNPYETGPACAPPQSFWTSWMPAGMNPWGPRTAPGSRADGRGNPLRGTSWLNRPYSAGWFAGAWMGPPLITGQVNQQGGFFGGYRFGWDYDNYWGVEARLAGSEMSLGETGFSGSATAGYWMLDANLLWYPWGDSQWRPYTNLGLGVTNVNFYNPQGHRFNQSLVGLPVGVGVKYYWTPWFILRADLLDNVAFGASFNDLSNVSLTAGLEFRFGGARRSYWPWNTGRTIW